MSETLTLWNHIEIWIIAFFTLSLFSFLYKDNPFYKFAEHIFAGLSAGYYVGLIAQSVVWTQVVDPLWTDFGGHWTILLPSFFGILMFARLTPFGPIPDLSWLSRYGLALVVGTTAGVELIRQLNGLIMPQTRATFVALNFDAGIVPFCVALITFVGVISTLIYFYFSKEHRGFLGVTAKLGVWMIMIAFGAQFGYTVMGRVSLLIGRLMFLMNDWIGGSMGALFS